MAERPLSELEGSIRSVQGRPQRDDVLAFICPACTSGHEIRVSWMPPGLYDNGFVWTRTGAAIDDMTLTPSIDCTQGNHGAPHECTFHGWVTAGKVVW